MEEFYVYLVATRKVDNGYILSYNEIYPNRSIEDRRVHKTLVFTELFDALSHIEKLPFKAQ